MAATVGVANGKTEIQLTPKDFKGLSEPDWCPGCGDFGVLKAMQQAASELGLLPHQILTGDVDKRSMSTRAELLRPKSISLSRANPGKTVPLSRSDAVAKLRAIDSCPAGTSPAG